MSRNAVPRSSRGFLYAVAALNSEASREALDPEQLRATLEEQLAGQEGEVQAAGVDVGLYQEARYAMVALADDLALHADWDYGDDWGRDLLEYRYFNTAFAGTEFFERLARLRQKVAGTQDPRLKDQMLGVVEVYLACLRLGFQGRYRSRDGGAPDHALEGVAQSTQVLLWPHGEAGLRGRLWERAYGDGGTGRLARRHRLWWWPIPLVAALAVGLWFLGFYDQKRKADGLVRDLHEQAGKSLPGGGAEDGR